MLLVLLEATVELDALDLLEVFFSTSTTVTLFSLAGLAYSFPHFLKTLHHTHTKMSSTRNHWTWELDPTSIDDFLSIWARDVR